MTKHTPVSIHDIAKALDVSASTVSRALKNHPDIKKETCKKIQEYAAKVHYRPNVMALGLKSQVSMTIGVITPEIVHHFFSSVISGIEDLAYGMGYRVMICQSNEDYLREVINLQALSDHRVDGLLVSVGKSTLDHSHFQRMMDNGLPIVFFDRVSDDIKSDRVTTNDFAGARMLVTHLVKRGCKQILHLAGPRHLNVAGQRYQGYNQALHDHDIPYRDELVLRCDTPDKVALNKNKLLSMADSIDGIFAVNDFTAIAAMQLLQEHGYDIPGRIAVAGFGDDPVAKLVRPALTTVEQRGYDMGREAARMLVGRLTGESNEPAQSKVLPAFLKIRDSA